MVNGSDIVSEISGKELSQLIQRKCTLVNFFAEWNMPCLMLSPVIEELAEKFFGRISFAKVNVDDDSEISKKFSVNSIPTIILFRDGKELARFTGTLSSDQFEEKLTTALNQSP